MPTVYREPGGPRKLEFWKLGRGGERSKFIQVPAEWTDEDIRYELEDWGSRYFPTSDFVSYGWNEEGRYGNRE